MTAVDDRTGKNQAQVTEREARQVAEAAREAEWRKPSFAKELFLGRFRLDLISPHPRPTAEHSRKGEQFLEKLRAYAEESIDGARIEREARIPDEVMAGLKELGALGMKIPEEYGGLGLSQVYYNKALALVGSVSRKALMSVVAQRGRKRRFCSWVPNSFSGCGTPID